ncbi:MAG: FKBP-type peptidyl-prolyl cis-trans isomerase [Planctomycetaceae bacterium]|nr:FKBP-type peptidyl-prolyl cis-trans isomerase [Planctomycetaceae bacterium]
MNRRELIGLAVAALATSQFTGCGKAPQVNDSTEANMPTAPELKTAEASGPGAPDADAPAEFTATSSGLKYRILRKGTGPKPTRSSTAVVNYKGWLTDPNDPFDQSYGREPFPVNMAGGVIDGWLEGLTYAEEGGMIELEIPPHLGYGERGAPGAIPPNATLHFTIEVLQVQ